MHLLEIHEDLLSYLLSDWFSLVDICRLDTSLCNSLQRSALLLRIKDIAVVNYGIAEKHMTVNCFNWLTSRDVSVSHLTIDGSKTAPNFLSQSDKAKRSVKSLIVRQCCDEFAGEIDSLMGGLKCLVVLELTFCKALTDRMLGVILGVCPTIENCLIGFCPMITSVSLEQIALYGTNLRCLSLSTNNSFEQPHSPTSPVRPVMPFLREVYLQSKTCGDYDMQQFLRCCPSLLRISMQLCKRLSSRTFQYLSESCPLVQSLVVRAFTDQGVVVNVSTFKALRHLNSLCLSDSGICDLNMEIILANCTNISKIELLHCKVMGQGTLKAVSNYCKKLTFVKLQCCESFTMVGMRDTLVTLKSLRHLTLNHNVITDISALKLAEIGQSLEELHLVTFQVNQYPSDLDMVETNIALEEVALFPPVNKCCLIKLAANCPKLKSFSFVSDYPLQVTDNGMKQFVTKCSAIESIVLSHAPLLTSAAFNHIGLHCKELKVLNVVGIVVTDENLTSLSSGCPKLSSLTMTECERITDLGVSHLSMHALALVDLNIGCDVYTGKLTKKSLVAIGNGFKQLKSIVVPPFLYNPDFEADFALEELQTSRPNLKIQEWSGHSDFGF